MSQDAKALRPLTETENFREQVLIWKNETSHLSSLTKAMAHPSYLTIIGLSKHSDGHEIERLILRELAEEPDYWFAALAAITGDNPVKLEHDFDQTVEAWLLRGREQGIV